MPPGSTAALLDIRSSLYALDVTTQQVQPVAAPGLLCRGFALSADDRFMACVSGYEQEPPGCYVPCTGTTLKLATLSTDWPPAAQVQQQIAVSAEEHDTFRSPTWSPDGRHLAVIETLSFSDLTLFARGDGTNPLAVSGYLRLGGASLGVVKQVAWSPDGNYLALFFDPVGGSSPQVGVISVRALPTAVLSDTTSPPSVTVVPQAVAANASFAALLAWTPDSKALTMVNGLTPPGPQAQAELEQVAVPSGVVSTPFLRFPVGSPAGVGPFAWMADGHTLLFAYGVLEYQRSAADVPNMLAAVRSPSSCGCAPVPAVIYKYTAP